MLDSRLYEKVVYFETLAPRRFRRGVGCRKHGKPNVQTHSLQSNLLFRE